MQTEEEWCIVLYLIWVVRASCREQSRLGLRAEGAGVPLFCSVASCEGPSLTISLLHFNISQKEREGGRERRGWGCCGGGERAGAKKRDGYNSYSDGQLLPCAVSHTWHNKAVQTGVDIFTLWCHCNVYTVEYGDVKWVQQTNEAAVWFRLTLWGQIKFVELNWMFWGGVVMELLNCLYSVSTERCVCYLANAVGWTK